MLGEKSTSLTSKCVKKGVDQHTEHIIINPSFLGRQVSRLHLRHGVSSFPLKKKKERKKRKRYDISKIERSRFLTAHSRGEPLDISPHICDGLILTASLCLCGECTSMFCLVHVCKVGQLDRI